MSKHNHYCALHTNKNSRPDICHDCARRPVSQTQRVEVTPIPLLDEDSGTLVRLTHYGLTGKFTIDTNNS